MAAKYRRTKRKAAKGSQHQGKGSSHRGGTKSKMMKGAMMKMRQMMSGASNM